MLDKIDVHIEMGTPPTLQCPSWAKEPLKLTLNARMEGLASKSLYSGAFKNKRRYLIASDGLYVWKKVVAEEKRLSNRTISVSAMALQMLGPLPDAEMEAVPVTRKVGNPRYDAPGCIVPVQD
jgi:putative SOS response-associated peptidase YedK